jgi:carbamoyl-phosphate synthase large subunit
VLKKKPDNKYLSESPGFMIQKYLKDESREFTSTTFSFKNKCYGVLSMNREMKYPGNTTKAIIKDFPEIDDYIKKVAELFNALGPANFQSRIMNGKPYVFEINCRFSGTTPFCAQVGFNTVEAAVKRIVLNHDIEDLTHKNGVMLRYFNEVFIPQKNVDEIIKNKFIENPDSKINKVF